MGNWGVPPSSARRRLCHVWKATGKGRGKKSQKIGSAAQCKKEKKEKSQTEIGLKKAKQATRKENIMTETKALGYDLAGMAA